MEVVFDYFFGCSPVAVRRPGWTPGKPRLGDIADIPQITGEEMPHDPAWSPAMQAYVFVQFMLLIDVYNNLLMYQMILSGLTALLLTAYVLLSLTSLGFLIDQRANAAELEMLRCVLIVALQRFGYIKPLVPLLAFLIEVFVLISAVYWGLQFVNQRTNRMKKQN
ncbi:hypothetical protein cypCar_00017450 [Cyprinus carpio]|nr:hypothetical protein cypCar_00017450 [Cyprinus carpio]